MASKSARHSAKETMDDTGWKYWKCNTLNDEKTPSNCDADERCLRMLFLIYIIKKIHQSLGPQTDMTFDNPKKKNS